MTQPLETSKSRKAKQEFVYFIQAAWTGFGGGIDCVAAYEGQTMPFVELSRYMTDAAGWPRSVLPLLQFAGKAEKYHRDFEVVGGIWVLSPPVREYFERIDPGAFSFRECRTQYPDGSPAPPRSLARVTRIVDAFDRVLSEFRINPYNPKSENASISPSKKNYFKKSAIGQNHFFYPAKATGGPVVSQLVKDEFKLRGWRGAEFRKAFVS